MVMRITHLSAAEDGRSQFIDETLTLRALTGNGSGPPNANTHQHPDPAHRIGADGRAAEHMSVHELQTELPVESLRFLQLQPGWVRAQSPAPDERYMLVLNGVLDVEASDGEMRRFGPGSVLLITDTTGDGHRARVVGGPVLLAVAPLTAAAAHAVDHEGEQEQEQEQA